MQFGHNERQDKKNDHKAEQIIVPPTYAKAPAGKRGTFNVAGVFFLIIIFVGVSQSLIGIAQFSGQHSIGLFWLKESLIRPDIAGVAKIIVNSETLIRAYGLFPHPNILGGFLFFSIVVTMLFKKMFHVEHFQAGVEHSKRDDWANCSTWNNSNQNGQAMENVPPTFAEATAGKRGTSWSSLKGRMLNQSNIINLILLIQIFGILLSFSKSAILALVLALIYIFVPPRKIHKCSTWNIYGLRGRRGTFMDYGAGVEHLRMIVNKFALYAWFLLLAFVVLVYFKFDFQAFFVKSLEERGLYLSISQRIISDSSIVGVGTGQFIFETERLFTNLAIWQYQPVHNVFLLIWSEWGIVGLVLFVLFLWKLFHFDKS